MRRLRTLAIVASLVASSRAAIGSEPDAPNPTEAPATPALNRPQPPASAQAYMKAGMLLFNKQRYDLAPKYLEAAHMYRERLTANEQVVLDEYRDQMARYLRDQEQAKQTVASAASGKVPAVDPEVTAASTVGARVLDMSGERTMQAPAAPGITPSATGAPAAPPADAPSGGPLGVSSEVLRGTADLKAKARWMLHQAREQIHKKHLEEAERVVAEVRAMGVKWGYFDDSPDKVTESIAKVRATERSSGAGTNPAHDRRTARNRLRQARAALTENDVERAETIVKDVRSWDLRYGLFDDTPEKVAAAVEEARIRAATREAEMMVRSYVGNDAATRGEPTPPAAPNPVTSGPR